MMQCEAAAGTAEARLPATRPTPQNAARPTNAGACKSRGNVSRASVAPGANAVPRWAKHMSATACTAAYR
eukprot:2429830-Alexandrium_andersonii.AAC.1